MFYVFGLQCVESRTCAETDTTPGRLESTGFALMCDKNYPDPTRMSLDRKKKPWCRQQTQADTRKTCKNRESEPETFQTEATVAN